jgi:peptide-methionine (S)-S-oxide reductase
MGGHTKNPTYNEVCSGLTNHIEVVEIYFNPNILTFLELLNIFWSNHNPASIDSQNGDSGSQYRSAIFCYSNLQLEQAFKSKKEYQKKIEPQIVTTIIEAEIFYKAEEYHQDYLNKNNLDSCSL